MNVIESIRERPGDWRAGKYYFEHRSGLQIWSANGVLFFKPDGMEWPFLFRRRVYKEFKWWCKNKPVEGV